MIKTFNFRKKDGNEKVKEYFNNIKKGSSDTWEYKGLILDNRMKILLISDPTTDKSAASLDVHVGMFFIIIYIF